MTLQEPPRSRAWHESLAEVLGLLVIAAVLTSPCWGIALIVWVRK